MGGPEDLLDEVRLGLAFKLHQRVVEQFELLGSFLAEQLQIVGIQIELQWLPLGHCHGPPELVV